ncbi:hypothetical protein AX14_011208 [Amanita brunnescens Koide BX004]|nr:hypothetical protein AX14_011208 [Amanita brunnescens Koide BX004]
MKSPAVGSVPSSRPGSVPAHTVPTSPMAVQPVDSVTKPTLPPPRPPRSPTRPPPRAPRPPPARIAAPKQSYAKAAASPPAAPAVAPPVPKAPAPPSKTAALRKSCVRQGTKATKVIVRFPDPSKQPSVNQLWGTLATFKPTDITCTLCGDFILTFLQVLDSDDHAILAKKVKKVYAVDVQVLNRGTTSLLKFPLVPTRHPDGSAVTSEWLFKTISSHPKWQNVEFVQKPRFIIQTDRRSLPHGPSTLPPLVRIHFGQAVRDLLAVGSFDPQLLLKVGLVQHLRREPRI